MLRLGIIGAESSHTNAFLDLLQQRTDAVLAESGEEFHRVELEDRPTFHRQLDEFLKLMAGKESEIATPEYGRKIISVLEEAFRQF